MLTGILRVRHVPRVPVVSGELPLLTERDKRRICAEQEERKKRLAALLAESNVFRQDHDDHH